MTVVDPGWITLGLNVCSCCQNYGFICWAFWLVTAVRLRDMRRRRRLERKGTKKGLRSRVNSCFACCQKTLGFFCFFLFSLVTVRAQTQHTLHLQEHGSAWASLKPHLTLWPAQPAARLESHFSSNIQQTDYKPALCLITLPYSADLALPANLKPSPRSSAVVCRCTKKQTSGKKKSVFFFFCAHTVSHSYVIIPCGRGEISSASFTSFLF